jgi:aspartyl-tRNA(Asn)/glutamyl-tRNA(Gln) amidotransferase subunit A
MREIGAALERGEYSSVEVTQEHLRLIAALDTPTNSFITVDEDGARARAKAADDQRNKGLAGPLTGIPIAHKDIFCTEGVLTTAGSYMLHNFIAPYNATVVDKLDSSGAVMLGKTNMDEFAMGSSNENSHFGAVNNPWNALAVPGGSSGGSAAAVALGLVPAATGTDTGGSIRQPASFCGITGLKPTYGRVSRYGMIAFASSLDQAGPMCRDAQDAGLLLSLMAGFDVRDSTSADRKDQWLDDIVEQGVADAAALKIGLPREYFAKLGQGAFIDELQRELERLGHTFIDVNLPHTDAAIPTYYVIAGAEASTNLSRYDGVRFGHRCENPESLEDLYERSRSEGLGNEVQRRILTGTYALSVGYYDAYYLKAQKIRRLIAQDFTQAFESVDVLLTPTTPSVAFKQGDLTKDPIAMYQQDLFTVPTSLAGLPAISFPCGFDEGLPLGAQVIAPAFREDLVLGLAAQYQNATDFHRRHPEAAT